MTRRNETCPCGSGLKYKKCCINKYKVDTNKSIAKVKTFSSDEMLSMLKATLENLDFVDKTVKKIKVKALSYQGNDTLICEFYAEKRTAIEVKVEIGILMSALNGFFKDGVYSNIKIINYAARAFDSNDIEIMYAICSRENAKLIGKGESIDWMKSTIFQENTNDYRLSVAKRQISEIENALRQVTIVRLSKKYGDNWFVEATDGRLRRKVIETYEYQFGEKIKDGNILIEYTYIFQLQKIISSNWKVFSDVFLSREEFENSMVQLNEIRREESHNRNITTKDLQTLDSISEFILTEITEQYPKISPSFLIDRWKEQLKEIMFGKFEFSYTLTEIQEEDNTLLKIIKSMTNSHELINYLKSKKERITNLHIPVSKRKINKELVNIIENMIIAQDELLELAKLGDLELITKKKDEIEKYENEVKTFSDKFILNES